MRMFTPEGQQILVDVEQVDTLLEAGWTKNEPKAKEAPVKTVKPVKTVPTKKESVVEDTPDDEPAPVKKVPIRKAKKITK